MTYGIIFNHLSLPFKSELDANNGLLLFFQLLKKCKMSGLKILFVEDNQDATLMNTKLANNYYIRDWYNRNSKTDSKLIDWCRFLKSIETKQPIFEGIELEGILEICDVGKIGEDKGQSVLLAAFIFNTYLVSFTALEEWLVGHIPVWVLNIDLEPQESQGEVLNLSTLENLNTHEDDLKNRRNTLLNGARDIWLQRGELFPNITLLSNQIGTSLQNWCGREDILNKARDALNILELFCHEWKAGKYPDYQHNYLIALGLNSEVSGESTTVLQNPNLKNKRMFWLEDAREVYCENHIKLPSGYRMHFYIDNENKRIHVAYLGPHLPTS